MKKALVTGATGAIGEAIVEYFSKNGYFVYAHYNSNKLKAKEMESSIENIQLIQFNSKNIDEIKEALKDIEVDVLVNNLGITKDNLFFWMSEEEWREVIDVNVNGNFYVTKTILPSMIKNKKGSIVNISSVSGLVGNAGQCNYSASKGALIAFSKALSTEVARYSIRVNAIAPGLIESDMTKELNEKELKKSIPLGRFGKVDEVAELAFFLGDKGEYITGEVVNISGGMVR